MLVLLGIRSNPKVPGCAIVIFNQTVLCSKLPHENTSIVFPTPEALEEKFPFPQTVIAFTQSFGV